MHLPPFDPPTLAELRAWWRTCDEQAIHRLILEIQRQRLTLLELRNLIDSGVQQARAADRSLVEWAGEPVRTAATDTGPIDRDAAWAAKKSAPPAKPRARTPSARSRASRESRTA